MRNSTRNKIISVLALVLCLAMATVFIFAFAGCDDVEAKTVDTGYYENEWVSGYLVEGTTNHIASPVTNNSKVVETVRVENDKPAESEKMIKVSDFDENGVAEWSCRDPYDLNEENVGYEIYLTLGGGAYEFYPYCYTLAPISMTAAEAEIQVTLIFETEPEMKNGSFDRLPTYIEMSSLTGEALDEILDEDKAGYWDEWERITYNATYDEDKNLIGYYGIVHSKPQEGDLTTPNRLMLDELNVGDEFRRSELMPNTVRVYNHDGFSDHGYFPLHVGLKNDDSYRYGISIMPYEWFEFMPSEEKSIEADD